VVARESLFISDCSTVGIKKRDFEATVKLIY